MEQLFNHWNNIKTTGITNLLQLLNHWKMALMLDEISLKFYLIADSWIQIFRDFRLLESFIFTLMWI